MAGKRFDSLRAYQQERIARVLRYARANGGKAVAGFSTPFDDLDMLEAKDAGYMKGSYPSTLTEEGKELLESGKIKP